MEKTAPHPSRLPCSELVPYYTLSLFLLFAILVAFGGWFWGVEGMSQGKEMSRDGMVSEEL
ncbi:MAG: hypothetical protein SLRJCFUN_002055 [Candidatus Fervidibacter sp.]